MSNLMSRIRRWLGLAPKEPTGSKAVTIHLSIEPPREALREGFARWRLAVATAQLNQAAEQFARVVLEALDG